MNEQVVTQHSLDPSMNPLMSPPHVVLDEDPNRPHPLSVNELDDERRAMDDKADSEAKA